MGLDAVIYTDENEECELASKRIGNVAQVAFLREFATRALGAPSLLVSKVLYSGTHCGDLLDVSELQPLASELKVLERTADADVQTFARDMLELVQTALSHERPIHFS
jgi:hypothetical protein